MLRTRAMFVSWVRRERRLSLSRSNQPGPRVGKLPTRRHPVFSRYPLCRVCLFVVSRLVTIRRYFSRFFAWTASFARIAGNRRPWCVRVVVYPSTSPRSFIFNCNSTTYEREMNYSRASTHLRCTRRVPFIYARTSKNTITQFRVITKREQRAQYRGAYLHIYSAAWCLSVLHYLVRIHASPYFN